MTETRQRQSKRSARFSAAEAAELDARAERAGVSVASLIRSSVLGGPMPRAARRPTVNHQEMARLIGALGKLATEIRAMDRHQAEQALRDLAEMRTLCFQALGREP